MYYKMSRINIYNEVLDKYPALWDRSNLFFFNRQHKSQLKNKVLEELAALGCHSDEKELAKRLRYFQIIWLRSRNVPPKMLHNKEMDAALALLDLQSGGKSCVTNQFYDALEHESGEIFNGVRRSIHRTEN